MKKLLVFLMLILFASCSTMKLYPTEFHGGVKVKTIDNTKLRKQIANHSNCGIFKKN